MAKEFKVIGKRGLGRIDSDGKDKATGKAIYARDIKFPGMLYAKFVICPYAHAKIKSMDTSKAEALPGVRGIIRYDDPDLPERFHEVILPNEGGYEPNRGVPAWLLSDEGFYEGVPVGAIVAADRPDICDEALKLIDIEWEELPFVLDPEEALKPGAPIVYPMIPEETTSITDLGCRDHRQEGNLRKRIIFEMGDVEQGFAQADTTIEFSLIRNEISQVNPMAQSSVVRWIADDEVEVWMHDSSPDKRWVRGGRDPSYGGRIDVPLHEIRLGLAYQGGTFGGWDWKTSMFHQLNPVNTLLAKKTGKPVKTCFSRREEFGHGSTEWATYSVKVGFKNDGTITAVEMHNDFTNSIETRNHNCIGIGHIYLNTSIPNLLADCRGVCTTLHGTGADRRAQKPGCTMMTAVFAHVATELGMDPTEVALKNDGFHGHDAAEFREEKIRIGLPDRDSLKECIELGKPAIDWDNKWHAPGTKILPNGKYHGIGFSWNHEWSHYGIASPKPIPGVIGIRYDGKAQLIECQGDVGVGHRTACCMIIAEELGMLLEDVVCPHLYYRPDFIGTMFSGAGGSATFGGNVRVIFAAIRRLKQQILERATSVYSYYDYRARLYEIPASFPDMTPEDVDIDDSMVFEKANPENKVPVVEVLGLVGQYNGRRGQAMGLINDTQEVPPELWADVPQMEDLIDMPGRQAHFCEVEVDPETGGVEITKMVCVNDSGLTVCPESWEGQQYGGAIMGLSWSRSEELIYDPQTGVILNANLYDYKVATILDCGPIITLSPETGLGYNPYGCMGVGEDNADQLPSMMYAAVHNAIGLWVDLPTTPEKILKALGKA